MKSGHVTKVVPKKPRLDENGEKLSAWRDASFYGSPGRASRYHIVGEDGSAMCDGSPLIDDDALPAKDEPVAQRCKRAGCREHWPTTTAREKNGDPR